MQPALSEWMPEVRRFLEVSIFLHAAKVAPSG